MKTGQSDHKKLSDLVMNIEYAMFTTHSSNGELISRPLQTLQVDDDGAIWFFTSANSGKVHDIDNDARVNLAYSDPAQKRFVTVSGTAQVVVDRAKVDELWSTAQKIFFPLGRDDPSLVLVKVTPLSARCWDGRESMLGLMLKFGRAVLHREASDLGRCEDLDLRRSRQS